ncbi:hypothetical protein PVIIG_05602 [Plasmodium vivax India VII]|uniref:Variable surface protein n=1 Tax=Plasmodium vivax India VII TaxID=1077284 RepID=A0A0J9S1W7_PLAVI|nr:hypothetical protein PVIIG_05602 [Plasmodium vivax India VII]
MEVKVDRYFILHKYPFLNKIWNIYKDFNKPVTEYDHFSNIYSNNISYYSDDKEDQRDICVKILRNLSFFCNNNYEKLCSSTVCCKYLNYWISYVKKKHNLNEKYKEPEKIIKLLNFQDNIQIFLETLKDKDASISCPAQIYLYECIIIYNASYQTYCSKPVEKNGVNKSVCEILDKFKTSYTNELYNKEGIEDKTPSISSNTKLEDIESCQEYIKKATSLSVKGDKTGSSISYSVSTAVVSMIGVSFFLSLIYKVNITCT